MARRYLDSFERLIAENQKRYLLREINRQVDRGEIKSASEYQEVLSQAVSKLNPDNRPIIQLRRVSPRDKISSRDYNDTMSEVFVDLATLFQESEYTADVISRHELISVDFVKKFRTSIDDLQSKIASLKVLGKSMKGFIGVHYEDFVDITGAKLENMRVTKDSRLELAPRSTPDLHNDSRDIKTISVQTTPAENIRGGIWHASSSANNIEQNYGQTATSRLGRIPLAKAQRAMLQSGNDKGYWAEVVMTDRPARQIIDDVRYDGIVSIMQIEFSGAKDINSIVIDPFCEYALEVARVRYKLDGDTTWTTLTYTDRNDNNVVKSVTGSGTTSIRLYNFPIIYQCVALELLFYQKDATINRYLVDSSIIDHAELWDQITDKEFELLEFYDEGLGTIPVMGSTDEPYEGILRKNTQYDLAILNVHQSGTYKETIENTKSALGITNADIDDSKLSVDVGTSESFLVGINDPSLDKTLEGKKLEEIHKYEYILGAYSITPQNIEYIGKARPGVYWSHFPGEGYDTAEKTITNIQLSSSFNIPDLTTVEFFIVDDENKLEIPIVPEGTVSHRQRVRNDDFTYDADDDIFTFTTSFPATASTLKLYRNGSLEINQSGYDQTEGTYGTQINASGIITADASRDIWVAEYDIRYTDLENSQQEADDVDLTEWISPSGITETIETLNVDQNIIELSNFPYIDYDQYNWDGTWSSGYQPLTVSISSIALTDKTDYLNPFEVIVNEFISMNNQDIPYSAD